MMVENPMDFLINAKGSDPLSDPVIIVCIVIGIIAIVVSAIVGTYLGRKKKAEFEARIAERRKRRKMAKDEAVAREKAMLKRYEDAKKRAEEEARRNPQPLMPVEVIPDEDYRPAPRGGGQVELVSTSGPRYVKMKSELGVSGSAPMRLSDSELRQGPQTRVTDTGEVASARAAKAKAKAVAAKPGPPPPPPKAVEAKVVTAKAEPVAPVEAKPEPPKAEPAAPAVAQPGPPKAVPPEPEEEVIQLLEEKEEAIPPLEEEDAIIPPIEEIKEDKKTDEKKEKDEVDKLTEMLAALDQLKKG